MQYNGYDASGNLLWTDEVTRIAPVRERNGVRYCLWLKKGGTLIESKKNLDLGHPNWRDLLEGVPEQNADGQCSLCDNSGIVVNENGYMRRCPCLLGADVEPEDFWARRTEMFVDFCQNVWQREGDCELADWGFEHDNWIVVAVGTPPRCRKLYRHIFVFVDSHLASIGRRPLWSGSLRWSRTTGRILSGKEYKRFAPRDYPQPRQFGGVA
jgi:hypothetical protein